MASPSAPRRPTDLRLDTKLNHEILDIPYESEHIPSAASRNSTRSFSHTILPSFRLSTPISPTSFSQNQASHPHQNSTHQSDPSRKYRDESRKLLTHVLNQLHNRPKPPSVFDGFSNSGANTKTFRATMRVVQGTATSRGNQSKGHRQQPSLLRGDSDSDDEDELFSTDVTFDLMTQLVSALAMAVKGNWQIFNDDNPSDDPFKSFTSIDPYRTSLRSSGRRSRSSSPTRGKTYFQGSELLGHCISILSSVISEDCRFQILHPRPSRPPNSLQSVAMDVAGYLLHMHRHNPKVLSQVGFALLPAFHTFREEMHLRLLAFFEDVVVRPMLDSLRQVQGSFAKTDVQTQEPDLAEDDSMIQIHVEGDEDLKPLDGAKWKPWSSLPTKSGNITSSNGPSQALVVYYLSSIIPPLLATILEAIDISDPDIPSLNRFYRLFRSIVDGKPDSYLDVLEVVAYHSPKARHSAIALLASFWPRSLGHGVVTNPLLIANPFDPSGHVTALSRMNPYDHQFVPWRFAQISQTTLKSRSSCWTCNEEIRDFGLLCPFCFCTVHFNCYDYPEGSCFSQYTTQNSSSKIAVHRFCHVLPPRRHGEFEVRKSHHLFRLVNLFTFSLCSLCKKPLWGNVAQGQKCTLCHQFVHSSCLSQGSPSDFPSCGSKPTDISCVVTDWSSLRHSFVDYYKGFIFNLDQLGDKTYEEISVLLAALWIQLQILHNGVALGSIVIEQDKPTKATPGRKQHDQFGLVKFELHYLIQLYDTFLTSGNLRSSPACEEYFQENKITPKEHSLYFDWATLAYITTVIKSPLDALTISKSSSSELLNVDLPEGQVSYSGHGTQDSAQTYEVTSLAHIRDTFGIGFNIVSDAAARHLMTHMQSLGFLERMDLDTLWQGEDATTDYETEYCQFPLPLGLDLSNNVETLAAAIEACLSDLDLSINEVGLLLLVRRFPYDGMMTQSALWRLSRCVLSWIFAEDDSLAAILRDYVPKGKALPGVRSVEGQPWPAGPTARQSPAVSFNNGRVYIDYRRDLVIRYAARWMCSLHDSGPSEYANMLFQLSGDLAEEIPVDFTVSEVESQAHARKKAQIGRHLRFLIKLGQSSIIFSAFDEVFAKWLELIPHDHRQSYPALTRLFNREQDLSSRFSTIGDAAASNDVSTTGGLAFADPWRIIIQSSSKSREGLQQGLRWLCILARSGVEIPTTTFAEFASLAQLFKSSWQESGLLVEALFCATWLRSLGRQELQAIISSLQARLSSDVLVALHTPQLPYIMSFIRQSLTVCLLLYGCERTKLVSLGLVEEEEISDLPSRRKLNGRGMRHPDFVGVDSVFIDILWGYVKAGVDEITVLIAKFFNLVISEAPLLEPFEIDNIILRNSVPLAACAWEFYGIQRKELMAIRTPFLVRLLVVDTEPFQSLWKNDLSPTNPWELRLEAVLRLFRIILDIKMPTFHVEDRQWRPSVIDIFYHYFSATWMDQKEEIRVAVDTCSQTLLPAHFEAIAACWNETLTKAPIVERVKLVTFLIQLIPHFPRWQVLEWNVIIETLLEDDYEQRMAGGDGPAAAHLSMYGLSSKDEEGSMQEQNQDALLLRGSLLLLSLQMIWHGVSIELFSLLRIKIHLVRSFGFKEVSEIPSASGQAFYVEFGELQEIPDLAFSCLDELMNVLDAYCPFDIAPSAIGGPSANDNIKTSLLVGSVFVDVLLSVFNECDLESLPLITTKNLVKCLTIIIYKHDLESKPLRHLQNGLRKAIRRTIDLFLMDVSYEIRQLAISACKTCIKRWPNMVGSLIYDSLETAARVVVTLNHDSEDELVVQARLFIETVLTLFSSHGVFNTLCKRHLEPSFFVVLKHVLDHNATDTSQETLRDLLLRDTLSRAAENDISVFQLVLENLNTYVGIVHHSGFSASLMQFVGLRLTSIIRRTTEWPYSSFDSTSLLMLSSTLIQYNKAQSRELLMYLENILRVTLSRFHASAESLKSIFRVTSSLYKRYNAQNQTGDGEGSANQITMAVFEILSDGLRGKARVPSSTLTSMVEVVVETLSDIPTSISTRYAGDGIFYLLTYSPQETYSQAEFAASEAVARLVSFVAEQDLSNLRNLLSGLVVDRSSRSTLAVRAWNFLVLAALRRKSKMSLRHCLQPGANPHDSAVADINRAYVAIKLWLLLVQDSDPVTANAKDMEGWEFDFEKGSDKSAKMIWNELWPAFETIVTTFEAEALNENISPVAIITWSSAAELFLFLIQAHVTIALENSSQIALLNRLRPFIRGDSSKFSRVARSISEPLDEVPLEVLVNQCASDMLATEKLHVLDSLRKERTPGPEKARRDARATS